LNESVEHPLASLEQAIPTATGLSLGTAIRRS
jgi:hypothetical protein